MRILMINSEYPPIGGGAGNASMHVAQSMVAAGHEVTILTSRFKGLPAEEIDDDVQIVRAPALRSRMDRSKVYEQLSFILGGFVRAVALVRRQRPDAMSQA